MTSILNEIKGETVLLFREKKKIRKNNNAVIYVSHIRNQNFIAATFLYSKVLAINQGDAVAPWPLFQFDLNCFYSVWVFLVARIVWAYFP